MKKDQSYKSIINAKKWMKVYLSLLFIVISLVIGYVKYNDIGDLYDKSSLVMGTYENGKINPFSNGLQYMKKSNEQIEEDIQKAKQIENNAILITLVGLFIVTPIAVGFFMFVFNSLFFRPLEEHQNWITKNGVFSDEKNSKNDSTNIVGRDNLSSYSVADEMLKWNDLLEKGLITKEEFEKAKTKLMNGEKA